MCRKKVVEIIIFKVKRILYYIMVGLVAVFMNSCRDGEPLFTTYTGVVVEQNSLAPLSDLQIRITDGINVYSDAVTNNAGMFSIDMAHNNTLGQVYLFIDGKGIYPSKIVDLIYTTESKYDYGMIYLYNQTDESLYPIIENVSWNYTIDKKSLYINNVSILSSYTLKEVYVVVNQSSSMGSSEVCQLERQPNGTYSCTINDLIVGEKYYFQVIATNTIGTGKSERFCRTFGMAIPEILGMKEATINSAVITMTVTEEPLTTLSSGICWSTHSNPTINDFSSMAISNTTADILMTDLDFSTNRIMLELLQRMLMGFLIVMFGNYR